MKISEYEEVLNEFKKMYGDLEVYVPDSCYGNFPECAILRDVEVEESEDCFVDIGVCSLE
jgi:hypothetical protein